MAAIAAASSAADPDSRRPDHVHDDVTGTANGTLEAARLDDD
jgi:hypothetical protein